MSKRISFEKARAIVDEFATLVVDSVRDESIKECTLTLEGRTNRGIGQHFAALKTGSDDQIEAAKRLVLDAVDTTMFHFLEMFDHNRTRFDIIVHEPDGHDLTVVGLADDIHSELFSWIEDLSKYGPPLLDRLP